MAKVFPSMRVDGTCLSLSFDPFNSRPFLLFLLRPHSWEEGSFPAVALGSSPLMNLRCTFYGFFSLPRDSPTAFPLSGVVSLFLFSTLPAIPSRFSRRNFRPCIIPQRTAFFVFFFFFPRNSLLNELLNLFRPEPPRRFFFFFRPPFFPPAPFPLFQTALARLPPYIKSVFLPAGVLPSSLRLLPGPGRVFF